MSLLRSLRLSVAGVFCVLLLTLATGCDGFLVCDTANYPQCMVSSRNDASPPMMIHERNFTWKKKLPLSNEVKYVGIYGNKSLVYLQHVNGTSWIWQQVGLGALDQGPLPSELCTSCPLIGDFNTSNDNVYLTGNVYYFFRANGDIRRIPDLSTVTPLSQKSLSPAPRPFTDPNKEALVFACPPAGGATSTTAALVGTDTHWTFNQSGALPSSFVLGDIDNIDGTANGKELILFSADTVQAVIHQQTGSPLDNVLREALQTQIDKTIPNAGRQVNAAFIGDINNDGFQELVYAGTNKVMALSYMGRSNTGIPTFQPWKSDLITFTGEVVRSLVATDLTSDGNAELIVETDQALHFYLSVPNQ